MAYDREHLSLRFDYVVAGTLETASTHIAYALNTPGWDGAEAALAELDWTADGSAFTVTEAWATFMGTSGLGWAGYSSLVGARIAAVGTNGLELGDAKVYEDTGPSVGAETSCPAQCSIVLSLRSGSTFGAANYGRMFIPHVRPSQTSNTPFINPTLVTSILAAARTAVNAITTALSLEVTDGIEPHIMTNTASGTPNPSKRVAQLWLGNVIDTQRRRRRDLVEVYNVLGLPT